MKSSSPDPLRQLAAPLEQLLTCGGDTRLALDPVSLLNGYGCCPFPRPEAFTFASSTATSISGRAYAAAAAARQALLRDSATLGFERAFDAHLDALRTQLLRLLDLQGTGCEIVFAPSGTDAQLHALFLARELLGTPLCSIIAAADETGSGTKFAAQGLHFNAATACGGAVTKGEPIRGMSEGVATVAIAARDASGALRPDHEVDRAVMHAVAVATVAGKRALLFAMDSSKFGLRSPRLECLLGIAATPGDDVQIVIDACQVRLGRKRLRAYLDQGFIVLITGSKFFTGAPFSGAVLVPEKLAQRCKGMKRVPEGMADYTNRFDWPASLPGLRAALPAAANLGQWLRWVSALEEMRAYYAVPMSFRELALNQFAEIVPRLLAAEPSLVPLQTGTEGADDPENEEMATRTIFPFLVQRNGRVLTQAQAALLYRALNDDVASLLPARQPPMQRLLAARCCHIGQPVAIPDAQGHTVGALRISAGARVVSETWRDDMLAARERLRAEFDQVRAVIDKIALLVRYFDEIERAYARPDARVSYRVSAA